MEWLNHLSKAIDYIENHLDREISYEEAARIACCSVYYFQRLFSCVAGISLSEYIRRRRMTQAAFELQTTERKVLDIALKYGYTSPTSFNRAFQGVHGIAPSAARNEGAVLNAYPPIRLSVQVAGGSAMRYRIEDKEALRIVGVRMMLCENMERNQAIVPPFWEKTLRGAQWPILRALSDRQPRGALGVSVYLNPEEIYYYIAAATEQAVPDGMFEQRIPAATWVVFENDGPFKELVQDIFKRFFMEWLPFSGYVYAQLPDIEVYPFGETSRSGHSEVWIAVKKERKL